MHITLARIGIESIFKELAASLESIIFDIGSDEDMIPRDKIPLPEPK